MNTPQPQPPPHFTFEELTTWGRTNPQPVTVAQIIAWVEQKIKERKEDHARPEATPKTSR